LRGSALLLTEQQWVRTTMKRKLYLINKCMREPFFNKLLPLLLLLFWKYTHTHTLVCIGNEGNSFIPLSGFILIPSVERFNGFILMCYEYVYCEIYFIFYRFCACVCVCVDVNEWICCMWCRFWVAWTILLMLFCGFMCFILFLCKSSELPDSNWIRTRRVRWVILVIRDFMG